MSIQDLVAKLSDPDENERIFAADDLGMTNDPAAVAPLVAQLPVESCRAVREMIILALRNIRTDEMLDHAVSLLASEDPFIRNEMASLLQSRGESAIPWLQKALDHPDPDVRKLSLEAGCQIPGAHLQTFLETGLHDSDPNVVISAVESLRPDDVTTFRDRLERMATTASSPMLTLACIETLGKLEGWNGLDSFLTTLGDRPEFQFSLIGAVGTSGESRHLPYLKTQAENPMLRPEVLNALLNLQERSKITALDSEWLAAMAAWNADHLSSPLQRDCIQLLRRLTDQPAAVALAKQLEAGMRDE